jgi:hypothetical protein
MIKFTVLSIISACIVYLAHKNGKNFYRDKKTEIFDLGIRHTPNMSSNDILKKIMNVIVIILPFSFGKKIFFEYFSLFFFIFIIRLIFISSTILPKQDNCDDSKYSIWNILFGHCYDKSLSGHFASIFLMSLILMENGIIRLHTLLIINVIWAFLILSSRSHYTNDILISIFVCLFIFQNKKSIIH